MKKWKRWHSLVLVWTLPSVVFLAITAIVYGAYRIEPPARLTDAERAAVIATLREAMADKQPAPSTIHRVPGPVVVTMWLDGRAMVRLEGYGADLGAAIDSLVPELRRHPTVRAMTPEQAGRSRLQVDVVVGRAPLGDSHWLADYALPFVTDMMPLNPGVEGVGAESGGKRVLLLPHELVATKLLSTQRPSDTLDFAMGVDLKRIALLMGARLGGGRNSAVSREQLYRFRTDTFVEQATDRRDIAPVQLVRGVAAPPALSAKALREAALAGGRYLVAHLAPTGRYVYEHDLSTGMRTDPARSGAYSMPRHAGTTYFLAELYRITKEEWLREPIERAFKHLADLLSSGRCAGTLPDGQAYDCVLDKTESIAHLGSTALTVVALAEYQRATGDTRYLPMATKFATFILYMQRPDGSFRHLFDARTHTPDDKSELLYYSGEAALALARMHVVTGDPKYAKAAERALDWLVDWYDFFLGGFFYGEEHWTCIAAEAIWPAAKRDKYREFCDGYGAFLRQQQPHPGDHPDEDDLAGAYNFTPFVPPYNTPAGSRTEAMISAYLLGVHHGHGDPEIRDQIRLALQYTLGQQIRPESMFNVVGEGLGGMPGSPIDRSVRIDYVQHVCSAMIRASEWIDQQAP
ncbi:MAG: hypothetical protein HOV81_10595 [Kofleriaceae bacterium]|nr:hypothetical protein [Kofleriaceae bacterium]